MGGGKYFPMERKGKKIIIDEIQNGKLNFGVIFL